MKDRNAIDIEKQLADLLRQESMMAFFSFALPLSGRGPASGIAKIAKPRISKSRSRYLAVLLILDTPSQPARQAISAALAKANWQSLAEGGLPGCRSIIPIPYANASPDMYFFEIDLYLEDQIEPNEDFFDDYLVPALARVTRLKAGKLSMWDDSPVPDEPALSFIERLKNLFK